MEKANEYKITDRTIESLLSMMVGGVAGIGLGSLFNATNVSVDNNTILGSGAIMMGLNYLTENKVGKNKNYFVDSLILGTSFMIGLGINRLSYI